MVKNKKKYIMWILLFFILSCASQNKIKQSDVYFSKALEYFENKKYLKAKDRFQNIIDNYPGTELGIDALYYLAFSEYELKDFQESRQSFKVYKRYSQDMLKVQSASFMISLCMFELTLDYENDQTHTYDALESFQLFIEDYPNSKFEEEAMDKIEFLRNKLALKQYETAKLYIKAEKYDSAKQYLDELFKKYYDTEYADDGHMAYVLIFLINKNKVDAIEYLENNKSKFQSEKKYIETLQLITNSEKAIKIKNIFFLDYFNKLL